MLLKLIEDINRALDHDCFFSALALALTLPDICGKAKYPDEKSSRKRYIDWYDKFIGAYEQSPSGKGIFPYLSGEVVYSLRCSFLHQGSPNIEKEKIEEECCRIDHFVLLTERKNDFNIYVDSASANGYEVNIRRLCLILTVTAKEYYINNKERFGFFNYQIVDLDERYAFIRKQLFG